MKLGDKVKITGNVAGTDKYPYHCFELGDIGIVTMIYDNHIIVWQEKKGFTQMIYNGHFELVKE